MHRFVPHHYQSSEEEQPSTLLLQRKVLVPCRKGTMNIDNQRQRSMFAILIDNCYVLCFSCLKVQGVCDHRGNIIWYSGPHLGVTSDIKLFRDDCPPLDPHEKLLGDKAYIGEEDYLIAPFKKKRGADRLDGRRYHFNMVHAWYRATIEHCFAFVKRSVYTSIFIDSLRLYR